MAIGTILTEAQRRQFEEEGYVIARGLFGAAQVEEIRACFAQVVKQGGIPGYFEPKTFEAAGGEPLLMYPRILYPHRILATARAYMLDPRVMAALAELFGEEPLAAQSMFYFKPPGARGQALHQDNYYLQAEPGTCIAAWTAIDDADQENGGLVLVPKTQREAIQCPHEADASLSYFPDEVDLPEGAVVVPADMRAGDVLFFNGSTIHGSYPNRSADRFRRSFICHYVGASTLRLGHHIHDDLHAADGRVVTVARGEGGGPCGTPYAAEPH
ncbi:phytanoyl-CoA dioxygenase family protein [Paenibacillus sp. MWE-103]|uniref:Phytanoyl-CoA dioxygenase family protein n=1 Tax=Paenibacillus artemisiicola TaxID=1172618 RepID=A0ABS3WI45_9BACL|nr:phytanoyl-CoA dioxygenase family protein [Paenibacillus artemisiicola]MBO7747993.1 phytanoyl-CoA dioxygenase family protein [Paenibacillus artemisiicola]